MNAINIKKAVIAYLVMICLLLSLCGCSKDKPLPDVSLHESAFDISAPVTREDYLNLLYGFYETDGYYFYVSEDYYEEKSKTEQVDYRYGDVDNINVSFGNDNIVTYEVSVYRQFSVYYAFDGTTLKTTSGGIAKKITKDVYDQIPLKSNTYIPPITSQKPNQPTPSQPAQTKPDYIVPISKAKVGDIIYFGNYELDGITDNGVERLEWRVLEKKNGRLFVITERVIDIQDYNKDDIHTNYPPPVTWEQCSLRAWLNNSFYNSTFTSAEKAKIPTVTVQTDSYRNAISGNDTKDKVFCLSLTEAATYLKTTEGSLAYASRNVLIKNKSMTLSQMENGTINPDTIADTYWLRTPGYYGNTFAMYIELDGEVNFDGREVNLSWGVRPAMYINID